MLKTLTCEKKRRGSLTYILELAVSEDLHGPTVWLAACTCISVLKFGFWLPLRQTVVEVVLCSFLAFLFERIFDFWVVVQNDGFFSSPNWIGVLAERACSLWSFTATSYQTLYDCQEQIYGEGAGSAHSPTSRCSVCLGQLPVMSFLSGAPPPRRNPGSAVDCILVLT